MNNIKQATLNKIKEIKSYPLLNEKELKKCERILEIIEAKEKQLNFKGNFK